MKQVMSKAVLAALLVSAVVSALHARTFSVQQALKKEAIALGSHEYAAAFIVFPAGALEK